MSAAVKHVPKPWGYEIHWAHTNQYVGKILHITAGKRLSLQYHNIKDETIYVHSGKILFEMQEGDRLVAREMTPGDAAHVTPPTVHRMTALVDSDILEVSTPHLDDVVRIADDFGREGK